MTLLSVRLTGDRNIKVPSYDSNDLEPAVGSENASSSSLRVRHRNLSSAPCIDQYIPPPCPTAEEMEFFRVFADAAAPRVLSSIVPEFDVRVDFRGIQVAVAKQLLHVTDAGAGAQDMCRARVAKGVYGGFHSNLRSIVADAVGDHLIRKTTTGY